MRKLIGMFIVCLTIAHGVAAQVSVKRLKSEKPSILTLKYDKFDQIAWISTGDLPLGKSIYDTDTKLTADVYFGIKNDGSVTKLRVKFKYVGNSWLFLEELIFLCGKSKEVRNNEVNPIKINLSGDPEPYRKVSGGGHIKEVYDLSMGTDHPWILYYVNGGKFTATKASGTESYLNFASFGIKLSKNVPEIYNYYKTKL